MSTTIDGAKSLFQWHHGMIESRYRGNVGISLLPDSLMTVGERVFVTAGEWLVVQDVPPAFLDGRRYNIVRPTASIVRCLPFGPEVGGFGRTTEVVGWRNVPAEHDLTPRYFATAVAVDTAMTTAALSRQTWSDIKSDIAGGLRAAGIDFKENDVLLNPFEGTTVPYQTKAQAEPVPMCLVPADLLEDFLERALGDGEYFSPTLVGEYCVAACTGQLAQLSNPPQHWRLVNNRPTVKPQEIFAILGEDPAALLWDWLAGQGVQLENGDMLFSTRLAGNGLRVLPSTEGHCYEVTSLVQANYLEEFEAFVLTPPVLSKGWDEPFVRYPGGLTIDLAFERDILAS